MRNRRNYLAERKLRIGDLDTAEGKIRGQKSDVSSIYPSLIECYIKYIVFKDLAWDFRTFDFDKDVALADTMDSGADNATDPNLKAFFSRGGKL